MSARHLMFSLFIVSTAALAGGDAYLNYFNSAYRACSDRYPPEQISASQDLAAARQSCYADQVARALGNLPPDSPDRLSAALQIAPEYAGSTFVAALQAGFDPYYAVAAATSALPQYDGTFAQLAISRGADPTQVTEATAAGLRRERY